jgi:hypothetical protein
VKPVNIPKDLREFETSQDEVRKDLDPDIDAWRDEPCSQAQIRKVYAAAREYLGLKGDEIEDEFGNFHHFTKGEISDLINDIEGNDPNDQSWREEWREQKRQEREAARAKQAANPPSPTPPIDPNNFTFEDDDDILAF